MKSYVTLPEGYRQILSIDLQKDKKLALLVNGLAAVISVVMVAIALCVVPWSTLYEGDGGLFGFSLKMLAIALGSVAYMVLHEAVHGIVMRRVCEAKVRFGFTGLYAFAGSDGYYCRTHYIIIALAPIVVWGIVLGVLNVLVPRDWFYVVYLIQVMNISGAAGDLYVSWKMSRLPADILVRDTGVAMTVFSRERGNDGT
ncbi:MAG: DUF3267 domain-containing protein [Oscillospiraceae bacterium]|nr:DUF3267 domain-containing protein [Oscillospiraceae bacterium]